ncbi:MAG: dockerin type I domain-containing protein [Planctomycetota bacterium]
MTWDAPCVSAAFQLCPPVCVPQCPTNSSIETENCDTIGFGNDPCPLGTAGSGFQSLVANKAMCGDIKFVSPAGSTVGVPERDAFRITLPDPDGNGQARVSLSLLSERGTADSGTVPLFVALIRNACDGLQTAVLHAQITDCQSASVQGCVPAGEWLAVVARGTFPTAETYPFNCLNGVQSYVLTASWNDQCGSACGTGGNCYAVHPTPGCSEAACCNAVCAVQPDCCSFSWDQACVTRAVSLCAPPIPTNDTCANAIPLGLGSTEFALVTATPSTIAAPDNCLGTGQSLGKDVWYRLRGLRGEVTLQTCGLGSFDSALVLYGTSCPSSSLSAVACSNGNPGCTQNPASAFLTFSAVCGQEYLLRVAAVGAAQGGGTLTISATLPACVACAADLNGDSQVNGTDLTALLSAWGSSGTADINGDGVVSGSDLTLLLSSWGTCP